MRPGSTVEVASTLSEHPGLRQEVGAPELTPGVSLTVGDELGAGAFGTVFQATIPACPAALVLKVFRGTGNTETLADLHQALITAALPAGWEVDLVGLPFWAGQVVDAHGSSHHACVGLDLGSVGYTSMTDTAEDPDRLERYLDLPLERRTEIACGFSRAASLLEQAGFMHADLNLANVFVNPDQGRATLIDADSGALVGRRPATAGKPDEFLAPELLDGQGVVDVGRVGPDSERWSAGMLSAYLVVGVTPLFFLRTLGPRAVAEYTAQFQWPDFDETSSLASPANADAYRAWSGEASTLPTTVVDAFNQLLNPGLADPTRRPTAGEWVAALAPITTKPVLELTLDRPTALMGQPVTVSWRAHGASEVLLAGHKRPAQGALTVLATRTGRVQISASNGYGTTVEHAVLVVLAAPACMTLRSPSARRLRAPLPR